MACCLSAAPQDDDGALRYVRVQQGGGAAPSVRIQNPKWAIEYEQEGEGEDVSVGAPFPQTQGCLALETERMLRDLGINDNNTYLYIQGHHLFDLVVSPVVQTVCDILRNEQENDIRDRAVHSEQARTEIACYENSLGKVKMMMRKIPTIQFSPEFQKILRMRKSI